MRLTMIKLISIIYVMLMASVECACFAGKI